MDALPVAQEASARALTGQWWTALFDASTEAQIVCDAEGTAVQINPRAARLFHLHPEMDPGSFSVLNLFAEPARAKLEAALRHAHPRGGNFHSVPASVNGMRRLVADLELVGLGNGYTLVTFRDASQRLRLESHVQRLITAIDATPEVFFITDPEMRLTFANPAFQAVTGYGIEEVLGRPDEFLRAPGEHSKVAEYLETVSRGKEWIGELVNLRADGRPYHVAATLSPISDLAGRFMGYVACERDLTVRKQLEDELRNERDFVQSILRSLDGAIYTLDRDFHLTHANGGWQHLPADHGGIHLDGAPVLGRSLLDCVPDASRREELRATFRHVLECAEPQENRFHSADGRHWLMKISPWKNEGCVRGLICSVTDQSHYHELQDQLFQSQKMEIIGTLAAGVAHDFNNLLQAIRGHTGLLLMQVNHESSLRMGLEKIDLAAGRAAEVTKQLLSFSRRSEEKQTVLDLNEIIQEAIQLARRTLRRNITLQLQPAVEPVRVKIDATRANQALINLCVNAQDAMPNGGRLTLTTAMTRLNPEVAERRGRSPDEVFACCRVADTGTGIPPEILPSLFKPFFTTKAKGKGTGLGLSIVQRIVQEAHGFIEIESAPGEGTTFHLYFPLASEKLTPPVQRGTSTLKPIAGRVLVVDDVDLVRDFTVNFLKAAGLSVLVADSGDQALQLLNASPEGVDLMFTDYSMPGMNGLELIEKVAAHWPRVRFLLASGYLDDATRKRIEQLKVSILTKPYEMPNAAEVIMRLLAG